MSERSDEALRRQTCICVMGLIFAGMGRCTSCQERAEIFSKRRTMPSPGERALPGLLEGRAMSHHWQHCATCHEPTQAALCGNWLLSRWEVWRLPREHIPALSWRCKQHARSKRRAGTAVRAGELGDLLFTLAYGHEVHWACRGEGASTPARIEQGLTTHQIHLNRRQRCYACGDQESEAKA